MSQTPSIGRIVHYALDEGDVDLIERGRRETGAQGNIVHEGDILPAVIVRVLPHGNINLRVFLDGNDMLWAPGRQEGKTPGTWQWPPFVPPKAEKDPVS